MLILEGIIQENLLRILRRMIDEVEGEVSFLVILQPRVVVEGFLLNLMQLILAGIDRLLVVPLLRSVIKYVKTRVFLSNTALSVLLSFTNGVGQYFSVYSLASRTALSSKLSVQEATKEANNTM